ncbi:POTRA domain-containing protein [Spirochaetota bacterium]
MLILLCCSFSIYASDNIDLNEIVSGFVSRHGDLTIDRIEISGNKRTEKSVIYSLCNAGRGDRISEFDMQGLNNNLQGTELFKKIEIAITEEYEKAVINIQVREKWYLIPIPIIIKTSSMFLYGMYFADANLLGYNKKLFMGGTYSNLGWKASLGYIDPNIINSSFNGMLNFEIGDKIIENAKTDGSIFEKFKSQSYKLKTIIGYKFTNKINPSIIGQYYKAELRKTHDDYNIIPESVDYYSLGFRLSYIDLKYEGYLNYGFKLRFEYLHGFPIDFEKGQNDSIAFMGKYSFPFLTRNLASIDVNAGAGELPTAMEVRMGGRFGFKTLPPQQTSADNFYSLSLSHELVVFSFSWFNLTTVAFFEYGGLQMNKNSLCQFYGPGGGLRVYLKKVAIPAMGFDIAYNIETGNYEISAAIGYVL